MIDLNKLLINMLMDLNRLGQQEKDCMTCKFQENCPKRLEGICLYEWYNKNLIKEVLTGEISIVKKISKSKNKL